MGFPRSRYRFITILLVVVGCMGLLTWWIRSGPDSRFEDAAPTRKAEVQERRHATNKKQADAVVAAPDESAASAAQLSSARRASVEGRWRTARSIAVEKWRADMLTATALGEIGAVPPMLTVRETGSQVQLTNRGAGPACVQLARVTRPKTDAVERCQVGPATCSMIKPGATLRLQVDRSGAKDDCLNAVLEFRVGNVDFPEPSWWSRTAFNEFADRATDISYKQEADLQADIARFEATVEDQGRAARWRQELAATGRNTRK
ncbi:MAG TPA: hypothetical protein VM146_07425 [Steroidobacteraceae bacterium]|nr:hypothetical protein [Steroidobacteraceae bacterium]